MPEMDGPIPARKMRKRNPNLKIIFVSAMREEAFNASSAENEQFAFSPKPFALSAGREKVKNHDGGIARRTQLSHPRDRGLSSRRPRFRLHLSILLISVALSSCRGL